MDASAQLPNLPEQPSPLGSVLVQNGRHRGTRRLLQRPLAVLGQAPGCDLRFAEEGVAPFHCAFGYDSSGPFLRALDRSLATRVNGQVVESHRLANGDFLEVGSLQLLVELEAQPTSEAAGADLVLLEREREALRVQAAAVAAQQAALAEEEARLDQGTTALARQEAQLAAHLDERQRRLDEEHEQLRREREAFEAEAASARASFRSESEGVARDREEVEQTRRNVGEQRRRLNELRRKLWKRYQRHWESRESGVRRREADLEAREARLQRRQDAVQAFFERVNGARELSRRQLREEAEELALAQQRWQESVEQEARDRDRRQAELERRAAEVASAGEALAAEQERWARERDRLAREAQGLEARIRHQRDQLEQLRREAKPAEPSPEPFTPLPMAPALLAEAAPAPPWPAGTRLLAEMLGDQRAHLAEQWRRLLELQKVWQEERVTALADLKSAAGQLALRERDLSLSEQRVRALTADLEQRQAHLSESRFALEAWQARLVAEQAGWQAQRDEALADLQERERGLEQLRRQFDEDRTRYEGRLSDELRLLQEARSRCDEARRQYSQLWQDCEELRGRLAEQERRLAGEALALERLREELVHSAPNSAKAESRLEKLTRREAARLASEAASVRAERERLGEERARLDDDGRRFGREQAALAAREREWSRRVDEWERRRAAAEEEEVRRSQELARLRARHALQERQLAQLRDEVERLARVLIEEAPAPRPREAA